MDSRFSPTHAWRFAQDQSLGVLHPVRMQQVASIGKSRRDGEMVCMFPPSSWDYTLYTIKTELVNI